jgi:uncharacterized protein YhbP (UPF0306 family)
MNIFYYLFDEKVFLLIIVFCACNELARHLKKTNKQSPKP